MSNLPPEKPKDPPPQPNFPPEPPQHQLQYRNPMHAEPGLPRNTVGKFFLRMLGGLFIGGGSIVMGFILVNLFQPEAVGGVFLFFLPFMVVLTTMIVLTVQRRKFGYITGILLAPVIMFVALIVLFLIICGGWFRP